MTGSVRCHYATDPDTRPDCGLLATVQYGRTGLCDSCRQRRSTLGKGQRAIPLNTTNPIDLLAWIDKAHHDLRAAENVLAAAVARARQHRHPWSAIGAALGISRQAAQQRFPPRSGPGPDHRRTAHTKPARGGASSQKNGGASSG